MVNLQESLKEALPLLDLQQACFSELLDEVFVNPSLLASLLLLFLSEGVAGVHVAIAGHASEDGPEQGKDRNPSVSS